MTRRFSRQMLVFAVLLLALSLTVVAVSASDGEGFTRWPVIVVDGESYYWEGAPDGPNDELDVPGHAWRQAGPARFIGKHYNTGPFGMPQWWSSDAPDGSLLYVADVIIDEWTAEKAEDYAARGYIHYHELVSVEDGSLHPTKVGWFKHIAVSSFTLDGGPHPEAVGYEVTPGIDYQFMPNYSMPYMP
ncbi:MAG: hypothetical protein RRC07_00460 [Anaerolineae bacterium]|nr:hypothetical protein [Anaerolineae bacterium]